VSSQHLASWLLRILGRKNQRSRHPASVKLHLEPLEPRTVPSDMTINFTNMNTGPVASGDGKFYVAIANSRQHYDPSAPTQLAPNQGTGSVHSYPLPAKITIPDSFFSGIIIIFAGKQLDLPGGENPGAPGPTDAAVANTPYEFLEVTTNGSNTAIDTSQVDQFAFPVTLTWNDRNQSVGVDPAINRTSELAAYTAFLKTEGSSGSLYNDLVMTAGGSVVRIESPGKYLRVNRGSNSGLKTVFDPAIRALFETARSDADLTLLGPAVNGANAHYVGKPGKVGNLNVLHFTSTDANAGNVGPLDVYEPLTPPSWVDSGESSGEMVFACDGVFADDGQQPGLNGDQKTVLGNLEVQLSAALNRGLASMSSTQWNDSSNFYPSNQPSNLYAKFIHKGTDSSNKLVFLDGKGYGFGFDETGGAPSKFEGVPLPATMTITLGTFGQQLTASQPMAPVPVTITNTLGSGTTTSLLRARTTADQFEQQVAGLTQQAIHDKAGSANLYGDVFHLIELVNGNAPRIASLVNAAQHDRGLPGAIRHELRRAKADITALQTEVWALVFDLVVGEGRVRQKSIHNDLKHILGLVHRLDAHLDE
jgi:hypothetical protein